MTTTAKTLTLWSFRTSFARGNHVVAERQVLESEAQQWLKVYRDDEPKMIFVVCKNKPKAK